MPDPVRPSELPRPDLDVLLHLSRLQLSADRRAELEQRLDAVLAAFADLAAVDTRSATDVDPAAAAATRTDEPGPALARDDALANAPAVADGCFLVPRVVEG